VSSRAALQASHPGFFFLDRDDLPSIAFQLDRLGWLNVHETLLSATPAGEGNMNYTIRLRTSQRSFILKQARPWVEKYRHIAAPWDRSLAEGRFYTEVQANSRLVRCMPRLLGIHPESRLLMLEDVGECQDFTFLYQGLDIEARDLRAVVSFLVELHSSFRDAALGTAFSNHEMRELNHEHIFAFPLRRDNGLNLDAITPGLSALAHDLQCDHNYRDRVTALGEIYLGSEPGSCLVHGDYFPGSWLKTVRGIQIIDPEFCFFGPPEFDVGVMLAHFHFAGMHARDVEKTWKLYSAEVPLNTSLMLQFVGVEIMRRLIGVAQLPIRCGLEEKRRLLALSRELITCP